MKYPYDTNVKGSQDDTLKMTVEQFNILSPLETINEIDGIKIKAILPQDKRFAKIRSFITPIILNDKEFVIDCRRGVKGGVAINYEDLPVTQLMYGTLSAVWMTGQWSKMLNDTVSLPRVFSYWISGVISKQYGLGGDERAIIGALAMAFYLCRNPNNKDFDINMRQMCHRKCKMSYTDMITQQALGAIKAPFNTFDDFVRIAKELIGNSKMDNLSGIMLLKHISVSIPSITESSLIFANAFEYPPAFCALFSTIANDNFLQKSSALGKVIGSVLSKKELLDTNEFLKRLTKTVGRISKEG